MIFKYKSNSLPTYLIKFNLFQQDDLILNKSFGGQL